MTTPRSIYVSALFLCWALLLAARTLGAAIYATAPEHSYEMGLDHVGLAIPAWACFGAAFASYISTRIAKNKSPDGSPDSTLRPASSEPHQ